MLTATTVSDKTQTIQANVLHLVTLANCKGDEVLLRVWTCTDSFADVFSEVSKMRAEQGLKGYRMIEALPFHLPF